MIQRKGYTLVEVMVSMGILSIISLLGYVAINSSVESAQVTDTKAGVQAGLRDAMNTLVGEVRTAYTNRVIDSDAAPEDVEMITVGEGGTSLVFQVPSVTGESPIPAASSSININWENEDTGGGEANGILDAGEDANDDGALTRRLVRTQDATVEYLGSANNISGVLFTLETNDDDDNPQTTLRIWLEASKRIGGNDGPLVQSVLESTVQLVN